MDISKILEVSEREYRLLPFDSYSSIKDFISSRLKYYKKYILKEKVDETKEQGNDDIRFGNICDCLKFTPDMFNDRYQVSVAGVPESPQMLKFINTLHSLCLKNTNESKVLCANLDDLIEEAYVITKIKKGTLETWKERFLVEREGYDYFIELKDRGDRIIIDTEELEWAQSIVDYMTNHPNTRDIMNLQSDEVRTVYDQIILKGIINGKEIKMMSDRVVANHEKKIIYPFDLKVMSNIEIFPYNYLKLKYYIQNAVYVTLLRQNFPDYEVKPIQFITVDKYRQCDPCIVRTSEKQLQEAIEGFIIDGRKYKGLNQAIEEMEWHKESGIWTSSKEIYDGHGYIDLKLNNLTENL